MSETIFRNKYYDNNLWAPRDIIAEAANSVPSTSNSIAISQFLNKSIGTFTNGVIGTSHFFSNTATRNCFSSVTITAISGQAGPPILLNDGRVVFCPWASTIGIFNPFTNSLTTVTTATAANSHGGCLLPDGRVVFHTNSTNGPVTIFNPTTNTATQIPTTVPNLAYWGGGIVLPDGRVMFLPQNAQYFGIFNSLTNTYSTLQPGGIPIAQAGYISGVLIPDGRVILCPIDVASIGIFNPVTNTLTSSTGIAMNGSLYAGTILLPDGRVLCPPFLKTTDLVVFNPKTNSHSTISLGLTLTSGFAGGSLLPNGNVIMISTTFYGLFNPTTNRFSTVAFGASITSGVQAGLCMLPDGRIIMGPANTSSIYFVNTNTIPDYYLINSPHFKKNCY